MSRTLPHRSAIAARAARTLGSVALSLALVALGGGVTIAQDPQAETGSVVATTEVLGSVVGQLVGDSAEVTTIMPSGADPHGYEPSARDAERLMAADVIVSNGLDLEQALIPILQNAETEGATWFQAADHVTLRASEGSEEPGDDDHAEGDDHGARDPHFWTDPLAMRDVVLALGPALDAAGITTDDRAASLAADLEAVDAQVVEILSVVPAADRKLVTGHRSLGYFADRYGFEQIGTVIPSLSTSGEPTARELARLIDDIQRYGVPAVFTEVGTPTSVVEAVAEDSGAVLVPLSVSQLPDGGTYQDLILGIATTVAGALGG
jgi:zinc/manganese transport system substrate-binding protein